MGGKKLSPEERLERLKNMQGRRATNFSGSKPPAEPPIPAAAEPTRAEKPKPPPPPPPRKKKSEQPPQPDLGQVLENMDNNDLVRFIQEVCRTENIHTHEDLAGKHPDMALLAMRRGLLSELFAEAKKAEPAEDATRDIGPNGGAVKLSLPPLARLSEAPPGMDKVTAPESGAYDPTTAVEFAAVLEEVSSLGRFMVDLINDTEISSKEKHAKGVERYSAEYNGFIQKHGNDNAKAILASARAKIKAGIEPDPDEAYVLKLLELQELLIRFQKIAKSESEARDLAKEQAKKPPIHTTGPISFSSDDIEIVEASEPVVLEEEQPDPVVLTPEQRKSQPPPSILPQQGNWFTRTFKNPVTWALMSISAYSAAMHITGAWDTICQGVGRLYGMIPNAPPIQLPTHADKAIWYGAIALGLGLTELIRRRAVKKEVLRLERRSMLGKQAQDNYTYVVQKLASVRVTTSDLSMQLIQLRAMMVGDEALFDAVDRLYRDEVIWNDIMKESRLDEAVRNEFSTIRNQAESEIIKKRLAQIVPFIQNNEHRKMKLKELYLTDPLFQRKIQEVFEQAPGGGYVNRDLRERLTTLKYDNPIPREYQKEFLRLLEEDFGIMQGDSDIRR